MAEAAGVFIGRHDFRAFSNGKHENARRSIWRSELRMEGELWVYQSEGEGYLYRMVRRIVGALVDVGLGKIAPDGLCQRLLFPENFRRAPLPVAPPQGLFLEKVFYADPESDEIGAADAHFPHGAS
jgi:tRNA pseudouridine38-40 synthase